MGAVRSTIRCALLAGYFGFYALELVVKRPKTRQARAEWLHRFCTATMRGLDVRLTVEGEMPHGGSVISNHQSYVDIMSFASAGACVFCSKAEIRKWPVVGWMTAMAGTVFVHRGRGGSALQAKTAMKEVADAGLPVMFFPEGTTSNGEQVLPFHSGLLAQAMAAGEPVTAAYIRYTLDRPNKPGVTVADDVAFWGETPMLRHIFGLMDLRGVHAWVRFAPAPIVFSSDTLHRKKAAVEARDAVLRVGGVLGIAGGSEPEVRPGTRIPTAPQ